MFITTAALLGLGGFFSTGLYSSFKYGGKNDNKIEDKLLYVFKKANLYLKNQETKEIEECKILEIEKTEYGCDIKVLLPIGLTISDIRKNIEVLQMALNCEIKLEEHGQVVYMKLGTVKLTRLLRYKDVEKYAKGMKIPVMSRYGVITIDFNTEMGANVLIAGAVGMGKSALLNLITTCIIIQSNATARVKLINNKRVDVFPFQNVKNVTIHKTLTETLTALDDARKEIEERMELLEKEGVNNVADLSNPLPPYYIVIDEYGRLSDKGNEICKEINELAIYSAEMGRSFDVHLVAATQRPDVEVIPPRIKAVCMTKIALKTTTESNSRVIIGVDDAYHLPEIQGRAILQKSGNNVVQIPYLSDDEMEELLKPFKIDNEEEYFNAESNGIRAKETNVHEDDDNDSNYLNLPGKQTV
jgi:DNA segregation ATPase FtsK/SpoIIIE-like protein